MELFMCNPPYFAQFLAKNFAGTELELKATKIHPAQLIYFNVIGAANCKN